MHLPFDLKIYLFGFAIRLGKNYVFEADFLRFIKMWSEPSINVDIEMYFHDKADHCPKANFGIILLWLKLIELSLYNIHHAPDQMLEKSVLLPCPNCGKEVEFRFDR